MLFATRLLCFRSHYSHSHFSSMFKLRKSLVAPGCAIICKKPPTSLRGQVHIKFARHGQAVRSSPMRSSYNNDHFQVAGNVQTIRKQSCAQSQQRRCCGTCASHTEAVLCVAVATTTISILFLELSKPRTVILAQGSCFS